MRAQQDPSREMRRRRRPHQRPAPQTSRMARLQRRFQAQLTIRRAPEWVALRLLFAPAALPTVPLLETADAPRTQRRSSPRHRQALRATELRDELVCPSGLRSELPHISRARRDSMRRFKLPAVQTRCMMVNTKEMGRASAHGSCAGAVAPAAKAAPRPIKTGKKLS